MRSAGLLGYLFAPASSLKFPEQMLYPLAAVVTLCLQLGLTFNLVLLAAASGAIPKHPFVTYAPCALASPPPAPSILRAGFPTSSGFLRQATVWSPSFVVHSLVHRLPDLPHDSVLPDVGFYSHVGFHTGPCRVPLLKL